MKQIRQKQSGIRRWFAISGLVLLGGLVLAGISYGPQVLGYYRFSEAVETTSRESAASGGPWPQLNEACMLCHGYNGNTVTQLYPRLAGQPAAYLAQQLRAFAEGQRTNPIMSPLAMSLSADDITGLAAYFAAQTVSPNAAFSADPVRLKKGERLVTTGNCAACHGAELTGQAAFPRLAGQGYDYLVKQLADFKHGSRKSMGDAMAFTATLSDEDIKNIASYLASYRGDAHAQ
ncbi:c-type cytochrome [Pseudomonas arsenicoxydans]|uniref:Cytochrome c4 n=1 Tax=Pseudomonas arsenicoxydans TaxID=702115 RepID=A0A502HT97_9PSED|nr:c-type cytochrome [Pseudomonas arsenicoxydans]TPG76408.1 cytochrome c4 [Pseudomonas arsenicoxydans]